MRKPLEKDIEGTVVERALALFRVFSIKLAKTNEAGYPDRLFLIPGGRPLFIEFKRPGEKLEPRQKLMHERLRYHGYEVQTHDTVQGATAAIEEAVVAARLSKEGGQTPA